MDVGKNYSYPDIRIYPTLTDIVKKIHGKFENQRIKDKEMLAKFLGHTGVTGAFNARMAALRAYGLIEGRGYVKITETGRKIALPDSSKPNEADEGLLEAVLKVPLWRVFYDRWTSKGEELPESSFWVDLKEIAGIVPDEARKIANQVRKAYLDDIRYVKAIKKPKKRVSGMDTEGKFDTSTATSIDAQADIVRGLILQGAYRIAKDFIDFIESKAKPEKEATSEEEG